MASAGPGGNPSSPKTPQTPNTPQARSQNQRNSGQWSSPLFPRSTPSGQSSSPNLSRTPTTPGNPAQSPKLPDVIKGFQDLTTTEPSTTFAPRPGVGKLGQKFETDVNMFSIDVPKLLTIFRYEVKVKYKGKKDQDISNRIRRRALWLLMKSAQRDHLFENAATDYQKFLYSTIQLTPGGAITRNFDVIYYEEEKQAPTAGQAEVVATITLVPQKILRFTILIEYLKNPAQSLPDLDEFLAAINAYVNRTPSLNREIVTAARGSKFYNVQDSSLRQDLGRGLEVIRGSFKSVVTSTCGLLLNLNTTAGIFHSRGPLQETIRKWNLRDYMQDARFYRALGYQLRLVKVDTTYNGIQRRTLQSLAVQTSPNREVVPPYASSIKFTLQARSGTRVANANQISVQDYFHTEYPNSPQVLPKALVFNVGRERKVLLPSNICTVPAGQFYGRLLTNPSQASKMIRFACRKPNENKNFILTTGLDQLGILGSNNRLGQCLNIKISTSLLRIPARALQTPRIMFANQKVTSSTTGKWNMAKNKFFRPPALQLICSWLSVHLPSSPLTPTNLPTFTQSIEQGIVQYVCGKSYQLALFPGKHDLDLSPQEKDAKERISLRLKGFKERGVCLLFVVLPDKGTEMYNLLKKVADTDIGIHTICTVLQQSSGPSRGQIPPAGQGQQPLGPSVRADPDSIANLLLKFNQKLKGVNQSVSSNPLYAAFTNKLMIVGADVTHPGNAAMQNAPSIASVVATCDNHFFHYPGSVRFQRHQNEQKQSVESIENLESMMGERLDTFLKKNKFLPEKILVYRDGVSNGQFEMVMQQELPQIVRACKRAYALENALMPKITVIVVQKRHHTRFFAPNDNDRAHFDPNRNPMPGMVVDSHITSEKYFDFIITSHKCIQGTSRPAKYIVLHDQSKLSPDLLQQLTLDHCFLFGRSTTSISVHPAARYADLLCTRARQYMHEVYNCQMPLTERPEYQRDNHWTGQVHTDLRDSMFYI